MSVDKTGKVGPTGMRIYTAGIAIQQVFILCFLSLLIKFHILMRRGAGVPERSGNWLILTYVMYFTLFTITVRANAFCSLSPSLLTTLCCFRPVSSTVWPSSLEA